jgi:xeroderma pigmentosum group C-complementing protein
VQYLLWHNTTRNAWLNDKETQLILVKGMSEGLKAEVDRWRKSCGIDPQKVNKPRTTENGKDWGSTASKLEPDVVDMSHGDPLLRLLKYVVAYWKKKFTVTVPGLRKQGYRSVRDRDSEIKAFARNPSNPQFGERIPSLEDFRRAARKCEGSRDLGAQLFTALLRGLGIQTRMVASLQPVGFGWTKVEDAKPKKVPRPPDAASSSKEPSKKNANGDIDEQEQMFKSPSKMRLITNRNKGTPSAPINIDDSTSELSDARSIYSNSDLSILGKSAPATPRSVKSKERLDKDLSYPIYWSEVLSPVTNTYYVVSTRTTPTIVTSPDQLQSFEPRGVIAEKAKQVICYVIAFDSDGSAKDVTVRYLKRHQLPGKTKGFRLPPEKVAIHNKRGKIVKYEEYDWFKRVMSLYARRKRTLADDIEEQGDLVPAKAVNSAKASGAETLQGYKNSAEFVLERHLRREEAILPAAKVVKHFTVGKGDKEKKEPVYRRKDVVTCKTVESWHKEGREIRMGEHPLKLVPIRAVTLIRKLEVEQATRNTGEKPLQGLYSKSQTDWIIPPPIKDGKIPRNAFGNIDVYVPSMVPNGAVHVPRGGTVRICKKLGIDFAEACIGFEFGSQRAVPILSGVVIAEENEGLVIDAWEEEQERKRVREDAKREKLLLGTWRKFALGLRIVERVKAEYGQGGEIPDAVNPFMNKRQRESARDLSDRKTPADHELADAEAANAGGFFHPGDNTADLGGGFLAEAEGDNGAPSELELHGSQSTLPQIGEHDQGVEGSKTRSAVAPAGVPRSLRASHQQAMHEESPDTAESETEANEEHPAFSTPKRGAKRGRHGSQQRAHVATRRVLRSALKATKKGSTSYTEGDSEGE